MHLRFALVNSFLIFTNGQLTAKVAIDLQNEPLPSHFVGPVSVHNSLHIYIRNFNQIFRVSRVHFGPEPVIDKRIE